MTPAVSCSIDSVSLPNWAFGKINYILSTTATIKSDSPFHSWNNIKKTEKLKCLKDIGATSKKTEETFRNQYNRIFGDSYDESRLLEILDKLINWDVKFYTI